MYSNSRPSKKRKILEYSYAEYIFADHNVVVGEGQAVVQYVVPNRCVYDVFLAVRYILLMVEGVGKDGSSLGLSALPRDFLRSCNGLTARP